MEVRARKVWKPAMAIWRIYDFDILQHLFDIKYFFLDELFCNFEILRILIKKFLIKEYFKASG